MKIVMVGNFGLWAKGTMGVRALPMAQALARRGHEVCLLLPPSDSPQDAGKEYTLGGVRIINLALPPPLLGARHAVIGLDLLRRTLWERPQVVHAFKPIAYAGAVAGMVWWLRRFGVGRKMRLVVDADDWEGAGGWNEALDYPRLAKGLVARQERWNLTHCDALTVASRTLQALVWALGVPPQRVYYIPNGVVEGRLESPGDGAAVRRALALGCRPVALLYTRFFEFGLGRLVEVWQRVVTAVPEAVLLVVGTGLRGEERQLTELLRQRGLESSAIFAGWVQRDKLSGYFAAADLAIYPYDDTLLNRAKCSVKLIDLLAAGLPVVGDAVGQNPEYIRNGKSGILLQPGDAAGFAGAVIELMRHPSLRAQLGAAAAEGVRQAFGWDWLVQQVERAYIGQPQHPLERDRC